MYIIGMFSMFPTEFPSLPFSGAECHCLIRRRTSMFVRTPWMLMKQRRFLGTFLVLLVISSFFYFWPLSSLKMCWIQHAPSLSFYSNKMMTFDPIPSFPEEWYTIICFDDLKKPDIEHLEDNLKLWEASKDPHCRELYKKFGNVYTFERRTSEVEIPLQFETKIFNWLGNNPDAMKMVKKQVAFHVINNYSHQRTIHAPLRSKRPGVDLHAGGLDYLMKTAKETQTQCDFCNYKTSTAYDTFGRYETNLTFTASNVFKLNQWHGLICPKRHNVLNVTADDVLDMFALAKLWFESAHFASRDYRYPMLSWDSTPHAGASQFHPHMQAFLDSSGYYGVLDILLRAAEKYALDRRGSNYFSDLIAIHHLLGLAVTLGNATAIVELTERGDGEITILSPEPGMDMCLLLFYVIRTYFEELGIYAFSAGIAFPNMKSARPFDSLPAIIRITTRGVVNNLFSEISGFDLYLSPNTSQDPYALIAKLKKLVDKYEKSNRRK